MGINKAHACVHTHMWILNLDKHIDTEHIHSYFEPLVTTLVPVAFIRGNWLSPVWTLWDSPVNHQFSLSESQCICHPLYPPLPTSNQSVHLYSHYSLFPKCTWNLSISLEAVNHGLITVKEEQEKITQLRFKGSGEQDNSKQQRQGAGGLPFAGSLENTPWDIVMFIH